MTDESPIPETTIETPVAEPVPRTRKRKLIAAGCILAGAAFLLVLKVTSERERIAVEGPPKLAMTIEQLQQFSAETAKDILARYHGESTNATQRALVERVGAAIVSKSDAKTGQTHYHFHLLAEPNALNLFALPDGGVYLTTALVNRMQTEGQLAAALSLGVAHVMARDVLSAPAQPVPADGAPAPAMSQVLRFTAKEELAGDGRALTLMNQAGYDPNAMLGMFTLLTNAYNAGADVEFFTTHPNTQTRMQTILDTITKMYPQGVPTVLSK